MHPKHFAALALALPLFASPYGGDPATMPLQPQRSIVFLGIEGDYGKEGDEQVAGIITGKLKLELFGEPVKSLTTRERMVWALLSDKPDKVEKTVAKGLKKSGYKVDRLRVSALSLLDRASGSAMKRGVQAVERNNDKVWGASVHPKEDLLWIFHEKKLESGDLLKAVRSGRLSAGFHHQEIVLDAQDGTDMKAFAADASAKLDLVTASDASGNLVLDMYFRDVEALLALPRDKQIYACPNVLPFLDTVPAGQLQWKVTLDNRGYPFVD